MFTILFGDRGIVIMITGTARQSQYKMLSSRQHAWLLGLNLNSSTHPKEVNVPAENMARLPAQLFDGL